MARQQDPGHYSTTPKKKKSKPKTPSTSTPSYPSAELGGKEVKRSHHAATISDTQVSQTYPSESSGVLGTSERRKASRSTRKSSTKKDRKAFHKAEREAKAFRGTLKNPRTKRERQLLAKGKAVRSILYGNKRQALTSDYMGLQDQHTSVTRFAELESLRHHRKVTKKAIEESRTPNKGETTHRRVPEVGEAARKSLRADLTQTQFDIVRLKKQAAAEGEEQSRKNIKKLQELKHEPGARKGRIDKEIAAQRKNIKRLEKQQERLAPIKVKRQQQKVKAKKQFQHGAKEAFDFLSYDPGDPHQYQEKGLRVRGQYEDTMVKYPGIPGWTPVNAARPAGELESAIETASWFAPVPVFKGIKLAAEGSKVAQTALRGARALDFTKGIRTSLGAGVRISTEKLGQKGLTRGVDPVLKSMGITARDVRIARGISPKVQAALTKGGQGIGQYIKAQDGTIIERVGQVEGKAAQIRMDEVAKGIDEAITSGSKKLVMGLPHSFTDLELLGISAAKGAGIAAAGGLTATVLPALFADDAKSAKVIFRDAHDLAVGIVPSTFQLLEAGTEAVRGIVPGADPSDSSRLEGIWNLMKDHDPLVLAAQGRWDEAIQAWEERPVSTLLELSGAEYALGRTAGTLARVTPIKGVRNFAGLEGKSLALGPEDTYAVLRRTYSPDLIRNRMQKFYNKRQPRYMGKAEIARERLKRLDEEHGVYRNEVARFHQSQTKDMSRMVRKAEKIHPDAPNALPFIVARIAGSPAKAAENLRAYRDKLFEQGSNTYRDVMINQISILLRHPEVLKDQRLWDIAQRYIDEEHGARTISPSKWYRAGEATGGWQQELYRVSSLTKAQTNWAKWIPYLASRHNGHFKVLEKTTKYGKKGDVVFQLEKQIRLPNGKMSKKNLNTSNEADLELVKELAKQDGVVGEPGFFSMRPLEDALMVDKDKTALRGQPRFQARSGDAVRFGLFDPTYNSLVTHRMALRQTVIDADFQDHIVNLFSPYRQYNDGEITMNLEHPPLGGGGSHYLIGTHRQIQDRIDASVKDGTMAKGEFKPYNINAARAMLANQRGFGNAEVGGAEFGGGSSEAMLRALEEGDKSGRTGDTSWVALPTDVVKRLTKQANVERGLQNSRGMRAFAIATREFKGGVLPFNPRWQFGNIFDMTFRAMMDGTGPVSWARGRALLYKLKRTDIDAYHDLMDRMGSGFLSESFGRAYEDIGLQGTITHGLNDVAKQNLTLQINTLRSLFRNPSSRVNEINRSHALIRGLTPYLAKKGLMSYRGLQEAGFGIGRFGERQFRTAQLGKDTMRYVRNIENNWMKSMLITPKALEDTIMTLKDTNARASLARHVADTMGDYSRLSPEMRRATMSYAPFALWARASLTWVLTLPAKHPAKLAVLTAMNRITEPERRSLGLSELHTLEQGYKSGAEGRQTEVTKDPFLLGSIASGGQFYPTKTLTSFGTLYGGGSDLTDFLVPQLSSSLMLGRGVFWTGKELVYPNGKKPGAFSPGLIGIEVSNLLETFFPAAKWYKYYMTEGEPDETSSIFDPSPTSRDLRDTYVSPFPGANRYEQPASNWLRSIFDPARSFPIVPEKQSGAKELPPARFGPAAEMYGAEQTKNKAKGAQQEGFRPETTSAFRGQSETPTPEKHKLKVPKRSAFR